MQGDLTIGSQGCRAGHDCRPSHHHRGEDETSEWHHRVNGAGAPFSQVPSAPSGATSKGPLNSTFLRLTSSLAIAKPPGHHHWSNTPSPTDNRSILKRWQPWWVTLCLLYGDGPGFTTGDKTDVPQGDHARRPIRSNKTARSTVVCAISECWASMCQVPPPPPPLSQPLPLLPDGGARRSSGKTSGTTGTMRR